MSRSLNKAMRWILIVLFAIIFVGGVAQAVYVDVFNKTVQQTSGADETQKTYFTFGDRDESTSTWLKRDFSLDGKTVDLQAQTVDGTLVNNSADTLASWEMTINIQNDCFINNAWVGTVEIHQSAGTNKEVTQTLDLRNYDINNIALDYLFDGDLLIPLSKGDYLVYHPSKEDEFDVAPHSELTMGMIFYYLDNLDLSNYSVDYYYHRDITRGATFIVLCALAVLWVFLFVGWKVANASYKRALKEMSLRKSGLASMSSIYSIICFVDLQKDELIPVETSNETLMELREGAGAKERLLKVFGRDALEPYRESVLEFVDISTLPTRLSQGSITLEYMSKTYGWAQIRLIAVDREDGKPLKRALLTIQDINDDMHKLEESERRAAEVELQTNSRSTFITGASDNMRLIVRAIDDLGTKILDEAEEGSVRSYARQIRNRGKLLSFLIDGVMESSITDVSEIQIASETYSLTSLIDNACDIADTLTVGAELVFETEVSPSIPNWLVGDARRIEQALIGSLAYATRRPNVHNIKLSIYGKEHDSLEHLLFSVKADSLGMTESEARKFEGFVSNKNAYGVYAIDESIQDLEGIALMLGFMDSELHFVNEPGESVELYFEIEQQIADEPSTDDE